MRHALNLGLAALLLAACEQEVPFAPSEDADTHAPELDGADAVLADTQGEDIGGPGDAGEDVPPQAPQVVISPDPIVFSRVSVAIVHDREVSVTNPGPEPVVITGISVSEETQGDLWWVLDDSRRTIWSNESSEPAQQYDLPRTLAPAESVTYIVSYENLGGAPNRATLEVEVQGQEAPARASIITDERELAESAPPVDLLLRLSWSALNGEPPPSEEARSDLNLHLSLPDAEGLDLTGDGEPDGFLDIDRSIYWQNTNVTWGEMTGSLDRDDVCCGGPLNIQLSRVPADLELGIGVDCFNVEGTSVTGAVAQLEVFVDGGLIYEETAELGCPSFWFAGTYRNPDGVTPTVDTDGGPLVIPLQAPPVAP